MSVDIGITVQAVDMIKQLNPFANDGDNGTINADSTHDELNPLFKKSNTHDDEILKNTCLFKGPCLSLKSFSKS